MSSSGGGGVEKQQMETTGGSGNNCVVINRSQIDKFVMGRILDLFDSHDIEVWDFVSFYTDDAQTVPGINQADISCLACIVHEVEKIDAFIADCTALYGGEYLKNPLVIAARFEDIDARLGMVYGVAPRSKK